MPHPKEVTNAIAQALLATYALPYGSMATGDLRPLVQVPTPEANLIHAAMAIGLQAVDIAYQETSTYSPEDASLADWPTQAADIAWLVDGLRAGRFRGQR